jgi:hypothetical protein
MEPAGKAIDIRIVRGWGRLQILLLVALAAVALVTGVSLGRASVSTPLPAAVSAVSAPFYEHGPQAHMGDMHRARRCVVP